MYRKFAWFHCILTLLFSKTLTTLTLDINAVFCYLLAAAGGSLTGGDRGEDAVLVKPSPARARGTQDLGVTSDPCWLYHACFPAKLVTRSMLQRYKHC